MVNVESELLIKLKQRVDKLNASLGRKNDCDTVDKLVNHIIEKYLVKIKNKENGSRSIEWKDFCKLHKSEIIKRDEATCVYCNKKLKSKDITLDHCIPVWRGGESIVKNVVVSCSWCNQDKGSLTAEEYQYKQLHNAAQGISPDDSI